MRGKKVYRLFLICLTSFLGCIQPFEVDFPENERILVISGVLTNLDKVHYVDISYTTSLNETPDMIFEIDADVSVEDEFGQVYPYAKVFNGRYLAPSGFKAEIGVKYQLKVLMDEQLYMSDLIEVRPPTEIENIHWDPKAVIDASVNQVVVGAQFFIDSKESQNRYFRYEWEGTHIIIPPYTATHEVINNEIVEIGFVPSPCYSTNYSNILLIASTNGLSQSRVLDVPVHFIPEDDPKLRHAYSLMVRQYSLTESAYNYYKQLKENNESSGSFFDAQQGSIIGNITNTTDPDSKVLGYFEVSGESLKRKKFTRSVDFHEGLALPAYPYDCGEIVVCDEFTGDCIDITAGVPPADAIDYINEYYADYIFFLDTNEMEPVANVHRRACTDCSHYASTITPDFWNE